LRATATARRHNSDWIAKFSDALGIDAAELFSPPARQSQGQPMVRIIGTVGADSEGTVIQTAGQETFDMAPVPPGGTTDSVALEVKGHSMRAIAEDGSLIYFEDQRNPPTPDMLGYYVIAELEDGRVLFKRLLRGSGPDLYMLESQVGPPIEDVRLKWAAEPTAIIPPKQARRVIRRAGERQVA
jgi:SOS-response transcriptional repressor LexA